MTQIILVLNVGKKWMPEIDFTRSEYKKSVKTDMIIYIF